MTRITANRTAAPTAPERGGGAAQRQGQGQPARGRLSWRQARAMARKEAAKASAIEEATELEGVVGVVVGVPQGFSIEDDDGDDEPREDDEDDESL